MADAVVNVALLHAQVLANNFDVGAIREQTEDLYVIVVERWSFGMVRTAHGAAPQIDGNAFADVGVIVCRQTYGRR